MATWKNAAQELMQQFGSNVTHWHFIIEVLTVMPEEVITIKILDYFLTNYVIEIRKLGISIYDRAV